MRKLISRYIVMIMVISSLILIGVFYVINNSRKELSEIKVLEDITDQVVSILELNEEKDEEATVLFQNDYLNRAESIAYIIDNTMNDPSTEELKQLAKKLDVVDIHVVNENGIIESSTDDDSIGLDFYKTDRLKAFIPLIESNDEDDYYINMNGYDIRNDKDMVYIGVKPSGNNKGMLQISVDPETLVSYKKASSIESAISSMPTRDYINILMLDSQTGELIANSRNMDKSIKVEGTSNKEEGIEILKQYIDHSGKIKINGARKLIVVKQFNDDIVVILSDIAEIYNSSVTYIIMIGVLIMILTVVIIYCLYKLMDSWIVNIFLNNFFKGMSFIFFWC